MHLKPTNQGPMHLNLPDAPPGYEERNEARRRLSAMESEGEQV